MRDGSDNAAIWNADQCMDGNKEACDELRRSRAAKRWVGALSWRSSPPLSTT